MGSKRQIRSALLPGRDEAKAWQRRANAAALNREVNWSGNEASLGGRKRTTYASVSKVLNSEA